MKPINLPFFKQSPKVSAGIRWVGRLLLAGILVWAAFLIWHAVGLAQSVKAGLTLTEPGLANMQLDQALSVLEKAEKHLSALRVGLRPLMPLTRLAADWPGIGKFARQAQPGLDFACELATAARKTAQGLLPAWAALKSTDRSDPATARLAAGLSEGAPYFYAAQAALARAAAVRGLLDGDVLPQPWAERFQTLDDNFARIEAGIDGLITLPELAGVNQERTYLLAAMNDDELRGAGGFISGLGLLRVKNGDITHLTIYDSYILNNPDVVYPSPPGALKEYMTLPIWLPRDANWSPDFPQSARDLQALYILTTGQEVDGVIAFDTQAVGLFVDVLGPLTIEGAPSAVDARIVQDWMRKAWGPETGQELDMEWWLGRKNFMVDLARAAVARVQTLKNSQSLVDLAWAANTSMEKGHFLLYFNNPLGQQTLERAALDGGVHPGAGDFLMLIDTNIGFNKVDASVTRSAVYEVDLNNPNQPRASLEVTYQNPGDPANLCKHQALYGESYTDMQNRCYWNAWRILAAGGSVLLGSEVAPVPAERLLNGLGWDGVVRTTQGAAATTEFSGVMVLSNGAQQTNRLEWDLPKRVLYSAAAQWVYTLQIQKQAGAGGLPLTVRVHAPLGTILSPEIPDWLNAGSGDWQWQGTLEERQSFELIWVPAP